MKELYPQKESCSKENGDKIEPSGGPGESEQRASGNATGEWFCVGRGAGRGLMANDTRWEAGSAGRAWAGHSEGRAFWAGRVFRLFLDGFAQKRWRL